MTNAGWKLITRPLPLDPPELRDLDESALVGLLLDGNATAWREFMRRYDQELRQQVAGTLANAMRRILDSDAIDDVIGDLYLLLIEDSMGKLRFWLGRKGTRSLGRWLGLLANGIAIDHIRAAFLRSAASLDGEDQDEYHEQRKEKYGRDADPNRGGAWLGAERAADIGLEEDQPKKRRRNRKSNDDKDPPQRGALWVAAQRAEAEMAPSPKSRRRK